MEGGVRGSDGVEERSGGSFVNGGDEEGKSH